MASRRKAIALACVAALLACALLGSAAVAKKGGKASSTTTIGSGTVDAISGTVTTRKPCRGNRVIQIFRVNSASSIPSEDLAGMTRTAPNGTWRLTGPYPIGQYFATVTGARVGKTYCRGSRSQPVNLT